MGDMATTLPKGFLTVFIYRDSLGLLEYLKKKSDRFFMGEVAEEGSESFCKLSP